MDRQQPGHERAAGGRRHREGAGLHRDQGEQHPLVAVTEQGLEQQATGHGPGDLRRPDQQGAAVHGVRHGAAVQAEHDQRAEGGQSDQADPERRAGDGVHLDGYGDGGELEADERHALADEQPPEGGVVQRTDVDSDAAQR